MDPGIVRFVERALALKDAPRRGWLRAGIARPESVADHSWGLALLAVALAHERPGLDAARLLELAIVHDVAEAEVGDMVPGEYASKAAKLATERAGLVRLLEGAPADFAARMLAAFDELAADETPEARAVHALDKLEMAFQARRYEKAGVPAPALEDFRRSAEAALPDGPWPALLARLRQP